MTNRSSLSPMGFASTLILAIGLIGATGASAATTIGQVGVPAPSNCGGAGIDFVQPTVTSGASYVVPPGSGQKIVSWTFNAPSGATQSVTMKVYRPVSGATFQVVGHDGPRNLTASAVNTFTTSVPVQPGDILGLGKPSGSSTGCSFPAPGEVGELTSLFTDLADGQSGTFTNTGSNNNFRLNISAVVAATPSNDFDLGKVKKNKNKGTAVITVDVPGPGTLKLAGTGIKAQRTGGATISKAVTEAGKVTLKVKAKGAKKSKLQDRGKVKVKAKITYTPSGDLPGIPSTETKKIKLIDN